MSILYSDGSNKPYQYYMDWSQFLETNAARGLQVNPSAHQTAHQTILGFKPFDHAVVPISGIELVQKIQKNQFKTGKWVAAQPQCRNFGMLYWPLDPKYRKPEARSPLTKFAPQPKKDHSSARTRKRGPDTIKTIVEFRYEARAAIRSSRPGARFKERSKKCGVIVYDQLESPDLPGFGMAEIVPQW